MEPQTARSLSDSELRAAVAELNRRAREHRLETFSVFRTLDANAAAIKQLQTQIEEALSYRAKLIEQAIAVGHSRADIADAAHITVRRLDAIRSKTAETQK